MKKIILKILRTLLICDFSNKPNCLNYQKECAIVIDVKNQTDYLSF